MVVLIYGYCYGVHAGKKLQSMANQYRLGNRQNEERSPYRDAIYLRLFGSNISIIPTTTYNALEATTLLTLSTEDREVCCPSRQEIICHSTPYIRLLEDKLELHLL
jgi:hypothetical protein